MGWPELGSSVGHRVGRGSRLSLVRFCDWEWDNGCTLKLSLWSYVSGLISVSDVDVG